MQIKEVLLRAMNKEYSWLRAAEILGIPYAEVTQCALITIGYTKGTDFKPAKRPPIETIMHVDSWGARP